MSPRSAGRITEPQQLDLPPRAQEVLANLTDDSQREFISELLESLELAREHNDLRPTRDVIEAWYRTLLAQNQAEYEKRWDEALRDTSRSGYSPEQVRTRLGL
jgi:DnaJ-domain-containing protein 1